MTATVHRLTPHSPSLDPMLGLVAGDMNAVNAIVKQTFEDEVKQATAEEAAI